MKKAMLLIGIFVLGSILAETPAIVPGGEAIACRPHCACMPSKDFLSPVPRYRPLEKVAETRSRDEAIHSDAPFAPFPILLWYR